MSLLIQLYLPENIFIRGECIMQPIPSSGFGDLSFKRYVYKKIKESFAEYNGFIYDNFPLDNGSKEASIMDIFMLSSEGFFFVIDILDIEVLDEELEARSALTEEKYYEISGRFRRKRGLRKKGKEILKGIPILILPLIKKSTWLEAEIDVGDVRVLCSDDLTDRNLSGILTSLIQGEKNQLEDEEWRTALTVCQGTGVIQPEVPKTIKNLNSKAAIIKEVQTQLSILDLEQEKIARQIPPGPQRIRGLAGSGKTVVMAMKAALMHIQNPTWDIVYVFYTQSLYGIIEDYITRFTEHFVNKKPNWGKIHILHGWGGKQQEGLYSYVCKSIGVQHMTLGEAKTEFGGETNLLGKACTKFIKEHHVPQLFDAILMDEAQDFDFEYFRFCHHILKEDKRLIWAYDEVQSISSLDIPTALEIFGVDEEGNPLVSLEGTYDDDIDKDLILYHCYRNPRPILIAAHFFGMGLFREEGAIQFIPEAGGWEDIGYKVLDGNFEPGQKVVLQRPFENSPNPIEKIVGYNNLLTLKSFESIIEESEWVSEQIKKNLTEDELSPEDILVICLDNRYYNNYRNEIKWRLEQARIQMHTTGQDKEVSIFRVADSITYSGIRRAKGNEATVVYVVGFDSINKSIIDIVQQRNIAFTAMTRSRGWCVITGFGKVTDKLFNEIKQAIVDPEKITFTVPNPESIQRTLDNIEYEKRRNRIKQANQMLKKLDRMLDDDDIGFIDQRLRERLLRKLDKR
ncbi:ATP-binding domain-containing protein [Bacillus cereus]|nr:ATP-binding domain-containing protein [Bacillus cereus]